MRPGGLGTNLFLFGAILIASCAVIKLTVERLRG